MKNLVSIVACVALLASQAAPIFACGMMEMKGDPHTPHVTGEQVLIVWDKLNQIEHFVRHVEFGDAEHLGFLVPMPAVPEVAEADPTVFVRLAEYTASKHLSVPTFFSIIYVAFRFTMVGFFNDLQGMITGAAGSMGSGGGEETVHVLRTGHVSGQSYALLRADNAEDLALWLKTNEFQMRPDAAAWIQKYVDSKWVFAAFKFDGDRRRVISTRAVRLSFKSPTPFFPYREPKDQQESARGVPRNLRVYFVGESRVEGKVGSSSWPGKERFALPTRKAQTLLNGTAPVVEGWQWLTSFDDDSSPRPASDELYFSPASSRPYVPVIVEGVRVIPIEIVLFILYLVYRKRRKTLKSTS